MFGGRAALGVEQECCFPCVLCDGCDASANLLRQRNGLVLLCTSCLYTTNDTLMDR